MDSALAASAPLAAAAAGAPSAGTVAAAPFAEAAETARLAGIADATARRTSSASSRRSSARSSLDSRSTAGGCATARWAVPDEPAHRAPSAMQPKPNSITAAARAAIPDAVMV
jgi:hypothetical protein